MSQFFCSTGEWTQSPVPACLLSESLLGQLLYTWATPPAKLRILFTELQLLVCHMLSRAPMPTLTTPLLRATTQSFFPNDLFWAHTFKPDFKFSLLLNSQEPKSSRQAQEHTGNMNLCPHITDSDYLPTSFHHHIQGTTGESSKSLPLNSALWRQHSLLNSLSLLRCLLTPHYFDIIHSYRPAEKHLNPNP
jgi:hypothetical protein